MRRQRRIEKRRQQSLAAKMEADRLESLVIGMRKEDLDTPALLIELDRLERNIERTAALFRGRGVGWCG